MPSVIKWNHAQIEDLLESPDGPVGEMLAELATKITDYARAAAPIMKPENFSWILHKSTSYWPPGFTKASVHSHMGYTQAGHIYAGANVAYGPTLFLERPARQLHYPRPFMSEALWTVEI